MGQSFGWGVVSSVFFEATGSARLSNGQQVEPGSFRRWPGLQRRQ